MIEHEIPEMIDEEDGGMRYSIMIRKAAVVSIIISLP
jgi:hypothetical protein